MTAPVLDVTAGSRMMWFDSDDERVESAEICDGRTVTVRPDVQADFRNLPFPDEQC